MAVSARFRRRRGQRRHEVHKPAGALHPRVERVGPHHFGIVSVDCAKARSKWMLADFFGKVLVAPVEVPHTQAGFRAALQQLRQAILDHRLDDDLVVAVERTGHYHQPVRRAFADAGFEVRTVHPSPPSSSACRPTRATRPTTPTSAPSTGPRSTASG